MSSSSSPSIPHDNRRRHPASHRHDLHWHRRLRFVVWFSTESSVFAMLVPAGPWPGGDLVAMVEPSSPPLARSAWHDLRTKASAPAPHPLPHSPIHLLPRSSRRTRAPCQPCTPGPGSVLVRAVHRLHTPAPAASVACSKRTTTGFPSLLSPSQSRQQDLATVHTNLCYASINQSTYQHSLTHAINKDTSGGSSIHVDGLTAPPAP